MSDELANNVKTYVPTIVRRKNFLLAPTMAEDEVGGWVEFAEYMAIARQLSAAQDRLREIEAQEPAGAVVKMVRETDEGCVQEIAVDGPAIPYGTELYARPVAPAAEPARVEVFDRRCNYSAFAGTVCNKCGRVHVSSPYNFPPEAPASQQPAAQVVDGYVMVRKEWEPIMEEVHRRADKECGEDCDFTVTVTAEEYRAILAAQQEGQRHD